MSEIEATRFYILHRDGYPSSDVLDSVRHGMWSMNVETVAYVDAETAPRDGDLRIDAIADLGPTVGIAGWIRDVLYALNMMGRPIPAPIDYPPALTEFLGRRVWTGALGEVRNGSATAFVKPVRHKVFTGFVWHGNYDSQIRVMHLGDEEPVLISEPVTFVAEYRTFVLRGEILDCRRYRGDWSVAPRRDVVEAAVRAYAPTAPAACCLDFGVTSDGRTLLVEVNDGYAFGTYGLLHIHHARMLSARWFEMAS